MACIREPFKCVSLKRDKEEAFFKARPFSRRDGDLSLSLSLSLKPFKLFCAQHLGVLYVDFSKDGQLLVTVGAPCGARADRSASQLVAVYEWRTATSNDRPAMCVSFSARLNSVVSGAIRTKESSQRYSRKVARLLRTLSVVQKPETLSQPFSQTPTEYIESKSRPCSLGRRRTATCVFASGVDAAELILDARFLCARGRRPVYLVLIECVVTTSLERSLFGRSISF